MWVKQCPKCGEERPATEFSCLGEFNGKPCNFPLAAEPTVPTSNLFAVTLILEVLPASGADWIDAGQSPPSIRAMSVSGGWLRSRSSPFSICSR